MSYFARRPMMSVTAMFLAVAVYLGSTSVVFAQADDLGKKAYERICGNCHGPLGRGGDGPPLVPMKYEFAEVLPITREGLQMMPKLSTVTISDEEIKAVVVYLKTIGAAKKAK